MIAALEQSLGIVSKAAIEAGIPRQTHYYWMDNDPNYRSICNELKNVLIDFGEDALLQHIKDGSVPATIFLLKCLGKDRGYVERSELAVEGSVESKIIEWSPAKKQ